jgi:acylpyruvate hydrolase
MHYLRLQHSNERVPLGKILCLGKNYEDHIREMKSQIPTSPVVFLKPSSAVIENGSTIVIPKMTHQLHHEVELVVVMSKGGKNIPKEKALDHVLGYGVGLDMTMRDVQTEAKKNGLPWAIAKGFDTSAPISMIVPASNIHDPHQLHISCSVNGVIRQQSSTGKMILRIEDIIEYLSSIFTLEPGDIIFTGTPEGVGEVKPGDVIEAELTGYTKITHHVHSA